MRWEQLSQKTSSRENLATFTTLTEKAMYVKPRWLAAAERKKDKPKNLFYFLLIYYFIF
jgi:hypothetical protein